MSTLAIGVDIGGTKGAVSRIDCETWEIQAKEVFAAPESLKGYLDAIKDAIDSLAIDAPAGVGISCGGPLDSRTGVVHAPPHLPVWDGVPIADILTQHCGCPALLQNDANAGALAEWYWGAGRGCDDLVFITFGTGFGAGIIANGALVEGHTGQAGEIGHIRLHDAGPRAYGKAGSVEAFCSGGGIAAQYRCAAEELFAAARAGKLDAHRLVREIGRHAGEAVAIAVDLLNPEVVVLGGIYSRNVDLLEEPVIEGLTTQALPRNAAAVELRPATLGEAIGDYACMAIVRLLTEPTTPSGKPDDRFPRRESR